MQILSEFSTPKSNQKEALFVFHDQLNLKKLPSDVLETKPLIILAESFEKGNSLPYHKHKLIYVLSCMRHFALECIEAGYDVCYLSSREHYDGILSNFMSHNPDIKMHCMSPSEWDSRERLHSVQENYPENITIHPNTFFLADSDKWKDKIGQGYRMEYFYRDMRKQTGYLMDGDKPEGGEWNYDKENRKKLPKNIEIPDVPKIDPDEITQKVIELVNEHFPDHFGSTDNFYLATNRKDALALAEDFFNHRIVQFGPYEDALKQKEYLLFHSGLSTYLNNGLLLPEELCDMAEKSYKEGEAPINSVEGYIRQIIGWREFIKIYYEAMMPEVREANHFNFENNLPDFYWTAETKMECVAEAVRPVVQSGYSHHIPRLMILSNIANLTETDPRLLNEWFWFAFTDAYEWVTLPNVLGMSTFADGGVLASKPYVSGGNYINKMSDHCKNCSYKISKKTGDDACPFNYLYWNFVDNHREAFEENGRVSFMVNMYGKKSENEKNEIRESSHRFISELKRR